MIVEMKNLWIMLNHLDLLVIVFMVLVAVSMLALSLMFLVRNMKVKKMCFYLVVALGVYVSSVSCRIFSVMFPLQMGLGVLLGAVSIAALVLERVSKGDLKMFRIASIMSAVSLVAGAINAFM